MATPSQIRAWIAGYNRNFDQLCQALMWQVCAKFGSAPVVYPSAIAAARASQIVGTNPLDAQPGDFHYWAGGYGHVALELGAGRVFMGSTKVDERWGINAGITTVAAYNARTGLRYLGFARSNGRNDLAIQEPFVRETPAGGASGGGGYHYYDPTGEVARRIQAALKRRGRYAGPVDGIFGPATRRGIQITLRNVGYTGPIDGVIAGNGARLIQVYAQKFGSYRGPIDAKLGPNSWAGFALGLERP